jgi:hypothetical protein
MTMRSRVKFLETASYKNAETRTASYKNADKIYVHKTQRPFRSYVHRATFIHSKHRRTKTQRTEIIERTINKQYKV